MKNLFSVKALVYFFIFTFFFIPLKAQNISFLWNTFAGSLYYDTCYDLSTDSLGNSYVTGRSNFTWGTPVNPYSGEVDAFVAKLDSNGKLLWNTFLGSYHSDYGSGIATDILGNIYVTGYSRTTWGNPVLAKDGTTSDAFVAKLDSDGKLLWNTFLGGTGSDWGNGIAVDNSGNSYVTGISYATWHTPVSMFKGYHDAFVAGLGSDGELLWNTFLGSVFADNGLGIAADSMGYICVTGYSAGSWGMPKRAYEGNDDVFVAKLNGSDGVLLWNTFLGGNSSDWGYGVAVDSLQNIFVTGCTYSNWGSPISTYSGGGDIFAAGLDSSGVLLWNTFLGSFSQDSSFSIAADNIGNIYIAGNSTATWGLPVRDYSGLYDAFAAKLDNSGNLLLNTFLGSDDDDHGYGVGVDSTGNIYVAGFGLDSWGSPINAFSGSSDIFLAKLELKVKITYEVNASVSGGNGSVSPVNQGVIEGENAIINITPESEYHIESITDNEIVQIASNPYIIYDVREAHNVVVTFKHNTYPPVLGLEGDRKTESAWIIMKDYVELNILISEHLQYPKEVSEYVLYKKENGSWNKVSDYFSAGSYNYIDKFLKRDVPVQYKLSAFAPDGSILIETIIEL